MDFEPIRVNLPAGSISALSFSRSIPPAKSPCSSMATSCSPSPWRSYFTWPEIFDKGLLPTDVGERAQVNRRLLFAATELEQPLWRISRHTALYPEEQRLPGDVIIAGREFKEMATVLEKHMQGQEFVAGDRVTVADFVTAYTLDWGNEDKLLGDCPELLAYMNRMYARPNAPPRIAEAFAAISSEQNSADGMEN